MSEDPFRFSSMRRQEQEDEREREEAWRLRKESALEEAADSVPKILAQIEELQALLKAMMTLVNSSMSVLAFMVTIGVFLLAAILWRVW